MREIDLCLKKLIVCALCDSHQVINLNKESYKFCLAEVMSLLKLCCFQRERKKINFQFCFPCSLSVRTNRCYLSGLVQKKKEICRSKWHIQMPPPPNVGGRGEGWYIPRKNWTWKEYNKFLHLLSSFDDGKKLPDTNQKHNRNIDSLMEHQQFHPLSRQIIQFLHNSGIMA